jgi:hypothetical protein
VRQSHAGLHTIARVVARMPLLYRMTVWTEAAHHIGRMTRDDELAAIAAWIAERGATRARAAYATPVRNARSPTAEAERLAAVRVAPADPREAMRALWATLGARRRQADAGRKLTKGWAARRFACL